MYYYKSIFREDGVQYGYLYAGADMIGTSRRMPRERSTAGQDKIDHHVLRVFPFPRCLTCRGLPAPGKRRAIIPEQARRYHPASLLSESGDGTVEPLIRVRG